MLGDQLGDFILRIVQVAENPGSGRTDLDAGRLQPRIDPMVAEIAFLDDRHEGVDIPGIVRTGGQAVFAADAPVLVNDHNPVLPFPCCLNGTIDDARRMIALIAQGGEEVASDIGVLPLFNNLHPCTKNPHRNTVLRFTGNRTAMAPDATPEIDYHGIPFLLDLALLHLRSMPVYLYRRAFVYRSIHLNFKKKTPIFYGIFT